MEIAKEYPPLAAALLFSLMLLLHPMVSATATTEYEDEMMSPEEREAAYQVLEAINNRVAWRDLYPGNPCLEGPHGLICGYDDNNVLHVVEFNLGWVSEADNNPQCGKNAAISPALQKLPYLRKLLFYNCFADSDAVLPNVLWSLGASLEELVFLRNPKLLGRLPEQIATLVNLKRLILTGTGVGGTIPAQLANLSGLEQLVLSHNEFTGEIPESLSSLNNLRVLDLSWNRVEGSIPSSLVRGKQHLQMLDLSHNRLSGSVPPEIGEASEMKLLDLSWNNLSSGLPDGALGSLIDLRVMQLSHNSFSSELPRLMWTNLSRLLGVGLSDAGLRGTIPESMGKLKNVRYMDLRGNNLEGTIPLSLGQLPRIYQMDLSGNRLVGLLPFPSDFVVRMGSNLRLGGNQGLCCSSADLAAAMLAINADLHVCDNAAHESPDRDGDDSIKISSHHTLRSAAMASLSGAHEQSSTISLLLLTFSLASTLLWTCPPR